MITNIYIVKPRANYELWMMMMCKYKFVNWNKWLTLGGDVDNEDGYVCVTEGSLEIFVFFLILPWI